MKNNSKIKAALFVLVLSAMSFIAKAQKNMWTGKLYNFSITAGLNSGSTKAWSIQGLQSSNLTAAATTTNTASFTDSFTLVGTSSLYDTLQVTETLTGCVTTNKMRINVYPTPTFTANSTITSCAALASVPGTLNAVVANFTDIKSITTDSFTLTYQLYNSLNVAVAGATDTLKLDAGSSASTGTVSLSSLQITALYAILNTQAAGTYNLKIKAFTTPATPTSTEAGAVTSIATTPITIQPFTINSIPLSNPIIAN